MDKFFASAYKGDPGVPHSGPQPFINMWIGTALFSVITWINPCFWQLSTQFNWHDKAFLFEQYHWKKARVKKQPYKFKWNQQDKQIRESYYNNWADYFP